MTAAPLEFSGILWCDLTSGPGAAYWPHSLGHVFRFEQRAARPFPVVGGMGLPGGPELAKPGAVLAASAEHGITLGGIESVSPQAQPVLSSVLDFQDFSRPAVAFSVSATAAEGRLSDARRSERRSDARALPSDTASAFPHQSSCVAGSRRRLASFARCSW